MAGKRKLMLGFLLIAIVAAGGVFVYFKSSQTLPQAIENFSDVPLRSVGEGSNSGNTEGNTMAQYDLTTEADGLSKAVATMTLENGNVIKWRFYTNDAPNTAKRIAQLISEGFYNGVIFHRVEPGFVVQGGDPTGTGTGGSGVKLKAEFNQHKHVKGIVSMARTQDPNSADSQFFMMLGESPHLDGNYTVFGKVVEGYEHVEGIRRGTKIRSFVIQ